MAVGIGYIEISHAVRPISDRRGHIHSARHEPGIERVDAFAEDANMRRARWRRVRIEMNRRVTEEEANVARGLFPGEADGEAQRIAIKGERRRHVLHMKDGGVAGDLK